MRKAQRRILGAADISNSVSVIDIRVDEIVTPRLHLNMQDLKPKPYATLVGQIGRLGGCG